MTTEEKLEAALKLLQEAEAECEAGKQTGDIDRFYQLADECTVMCDVIKYVS